MAAFENLVNTAATQGNPIDALRAFSHREDQMEQARRVGDMRFVGYVLELGFDSAKIITSDPYKLAVGGIPRGSISHHDSAKRGEYSTAFHAIACYWRFTDSAVESSSQTYFELHKKSMPERDVWTQSELQWGALDCDVLGMFYANPEHTETVFRAM